MGKGQGSLRRTAGIGAFVAIVMLALSLPSIAFAANTTIFRSLTPKAGSRTSVSKPKISVICYDKYGVKRASRTSMTLDGVKVAKTLTWYRGWHHKKFKLTYKVRSALSLGSHKVVVRVVDRRHKRSRKTWRFTVVDRTPPVTTSDVARGYTGSATIHLSATDNVGGSGVAHTYYKLDDGARTEGTAITVSVVGVHTLEFWSVDARGNAESRHVVSFRVRTTHTVSGPCFNAGCHSTDVTVIHSAWANPPGCAACHSAGKTPSLDCATCHSNIGTVHGFAHANASGTKSTACTACHGTDLPTVHIAKGCVCHTASFLVGEMTTLLAAGNAECVDCHKGDHAGHGFDMTASGHSTTTYGKKGPYTKFDGSQGPLLQWKAEKTTTLAGYADGRNGAYRVGDIATVTTAWDFPTVNVFWKSDDASAPDTAIKGLTKNSIITCQDCHTGLNASGPHGAAQNWGLDPNYPGDFSYAELTKYVTCNSQYSSTMPAEVAQYGIPLSVSGIAMRSGLTSAATLKSRTDGTTGATAVICAKCHDLENVVTAANNGTALDSVEGANTAHDSHHQDQVDGSAQCVNCHIGVPHGWKMPRLLVDTDVNVAPYRDPQQIGTTRTFSTGNNVGNTINPLTGFNGQGMQALSGVNDHPLGGPGGTQPYGTGDGLPTATLNLGHVGTAYWSEEQCQACGEHSGTKNAPAAQIINEP